MGPAPSTRLPSLVKRTAGGFDYLFEKNIYDLPDAERPDCHKNGTSYLSVYGRMRPDRPAQTITTGIGSPGQGRFIHPTRRRLITPHEAARIQGFPDWFLFSLEGREPSRKDLAKWIGDAVPPFLGFVVTSFTLGAMLGARPVVPEAAEPELPLEPVAAE